MSRRVGGTVSPTKGRIETVEDANDASAIVWREVPRGVVHTQIPYLWPVQCAEFVEFERGEIQGSRHGLDPNRQELAGRSSFALSILLPQVARHRFGTEA